MLRVRLQVVHEILARALATIDQNPQVLENLLNTAQQTLGPQGPVTRTVEQVGGTAQQTQGPGGAATHAVNQVGGAAQQAAGQAGGNDWDRGGRGPLQPSVHVIASAKIANRGSKKDR